MRKWRRRFGSESQSSFASAGIMSSRFFGPKRGISGKQPFDCSLPHEVEKLALKFCFELVWKKRLHG